MTTEIGFVFKEYNLELAYVQYMYKTFNFF